MGMSWDLDQKDGTKLYMFFEGFVTLFEHHHTILLKEKEWSSTRSSKPNAIDDFGGHGSNTNSKRVQK